jgi:c-di-GMP-binding flagellar brake protein YcgR
MSPTQPGWGRPDRRLAVRYGLPLPITARRVLAQETTPIAGTIRNISIGGVYFTTNEQLAVGCELDLTLVLPEELTEGPEVLVRARSRVVRVETQATTKRVGVAAAFEKYEIVRAKPRRV